MKRRNFLHAVTAAGITAVATGCAQDATPGIAGPTRQTPTPSASPTPAPPTAAPQASPTAVPQAPSQADPGMSMAVPGIERAALPQAGNGIFKLPVTGNFLSWTVDDGGDSAVIRAYAEMARDSGVRLTFFPNGRYSGWTENAELIAPMVATGQIEIGNHTFNHLDLTTLTDQQIVDELSLNDEHLSGLFGATLKPFYRPPFGYRNARTDAAAASIGYTNPVMWHGSLADSGAISEEQLLTFAQQWFLAEHIIIGHANHPAVVNVFPQLLQLLRDRALLTVTLRDVFVV